MLKLIATRASKPSENKTDWSEFDEWFANRYPAPNFRDNRYHAITKK